MFKAAGQLSLFVEDYAGFAASVMEDEYVKRFDLCAPIVLIYLPINTAVARRCARLHVPDKHSERDALIAATALVYA